jgi:hypothetical protein
MSGLYYRKGFLYPVVILSIAAADLTTEEDVYDQIYELSFSFYLKFISKKAIMTDIYHFRRNPGSALY